MEEVVVGTKEQNVRFVYRLQVLCQGGCYLLTEEDMHHLV